MIWPSIVRSNVPQPVTQLTKTHAVSSPYNAPSKAFFVCVMRSPPRVIVVDCEQFFVLAQGRGQQFYVCVPTRGQRR